MDRPEPLQLLTEAMDRLRAAEADVLARIAKDAKAEDREEYRDIRDTLETIDGEIHRHKSRLVKLLKALHIIPK